MLGIFGGIFPLKSRYLPVLANRTINSTIHWIEELGLLTVLIARVVVAGYSLMSLSGLSPLMLWPHKISFRLTGSQQAILVIRSIPIFP